MKLDLTNFFAPSGITPENFAGFSTRIPDLLAKIENRQQDFYQIFSDPNFQDEVAEIKKFARNLAGKYDDIVVCGTGGSALGALAIQESLSSKIPRNFPRLHILENIDPEVIGDLTAFLDFSKTLFIIISKSGGTIETISQYQYFREISARQNLQTADHFIFITGQTGFLREEAQQEGVKAFSVPEKIGGRFSVLTAVGLLPAALIGVNIDELLAGGREMVRNFQSENFAENLPLQLALAQFLAKKPQNVLFPYSAKMKKLGNWWAQLLAESTGKDGQGITPLPAQGVTDQHSQLQLFVDGPNDKFLIFIEISRDFQNPELEKFQKLMTAELRGTIQSLTEKNRPNCTIQINKISPQTLGQLLMLFMGATAFLGELMEINAFDQPGVERGKILAKKFLKETLIINNAK